MGNVPIATQYYFTSLLLFAVLLKITRNPTISVLAIVGLGLCLACLPVRAQIPGSDLGGQWLHSAWFGTFNSTFQPWIYHSQHDWLFVNPGSAESDLFLFDQVLGWFWTAKDLYPEMFAFDRGVWLRYEPETVEPRRFFDSAISDWVEYFPFDRFDRVHDFDISNLVLSPVFRGTSDRDNIPAIREPRFTPVAQVGFLNGDDVLMTVTVATETRGYPLRILNWHEIVNDQIGDAYFSVTYCPLCFSGLAFDRVVNGKVLTFGVSGLLHKNNLIMYDRNTESLWSQFQLESVSGKMLKTRLEWIPSGQMNWQSFRERYPDAVVLNTDTGFDRDYDRDPYSNYELSDDILFPVENGSHELHSKTVVWGIEVDGVARAYPRNDLPDGQTIEDTINGKAFRITYRADSESIEVVDAESGEPVQGLWSFWFSWGDFFPDTTIWSPG